MKRNTNVFCAAGLALALFCECAGTVNNASTGTDRIGLETLDLSTMTSGWNPPKVNVANGGTPFRIGGETFKRGVGTHAASFYEIEVKGEAVRFTATIGADAGMEIARRGSVRFSVFADGRRVFRSPVHRFGNAAERIDVPLRGAKRVILWVDDAGDGLCNDIADWCEADFEVMPGTTLRPVRYETVPEQFGILSPKIGDEPRLNAPYVFGVRPTHPLLFTLPCSGARPMTFTAKGLPAGVTLDAKSGILTGAIAGRGEYPVTVTATNGKGSDTRVYRLVVGERIALTPPMGWNSWNCFASAVSADDIRAAADAFVRERLIDFGWSYVNIDDFWCNYQRDDAHPDIHGPMRRRNGTVVTNARFPDMKGLADYVHAKGLKIGIYSSPGPLTCGGCTGSWGYEAIDAATWAAWGFDYVKYDWCSYTDVAVAKDDPTLYYQAPYLKLGRELARQDRDIVYSICQYGMDWVSRWGDKVGGQCWRTTHDIEDTWESMRFIAAAQRGLERFAGPGGWNDPDMLIVGWVGWGPKLHPTRLTPNEQYTHMTLWSLFAAPLLIGCDLTKLDDFTRAILTNPEVLAVNQDPLGKAAARVGGDDPGFYEDIWARPLEDGSIAVGIVNLSYETRTIAVDLRGLGLVGEWKVRDLWRRIDEKPVRDVYTVTLPAHAPHFIRLTAGADGRLAPGVTDVRDAAWNVHFGPDRDTKATVEKGCPTCPKGK